MAARRSFGNIRRLPSGRYQARHTGPDGATYTAPVTFQTKMDAEAWLSLQQADMVRRAWKPPAATEITLDDYWAQWISTRDLRPRTRHDYKRLYDRLIEPELGANPLTALTPAAIRSWYATLDPQKRTQRAHAYGLLRTVLATAVTDELIPTNPAHIRGAGSSRRQRRVEPATMAELEVIVTVMPDRLRFMIHLATWCALRFGELVELRRDDVDADGMVVHVRRGASRVPGDGVHIGGPKTAAGVRDVAIPPHLHSAVTHHFATHVGAAGDALLFPATHGGTLAPSSFDRHWYKARGKAGRTDLHLHDLRHTGAVLAAQSGATLAELMSRLGHSSPAAALQYQHAAQGRDALLAREMSRRFAERDG